MAVALEQFVKQIEDSGVVAPGKLENFVPPKAYPKDAQELARQLVRSNHLTKFQAQEIYQGRAKSLILGNYTILDSIGAGGMGQVFKAEHRRMKRIVAIKMLPRAVTKDAEAVARFQREVEAAAKLRHPNIVAADDADEAGGVHFLVMEYIGGSDLSALVKKNGPFSVAKAVNYVLQTARGLEFAHKKGVIHRDVKPANLLLDPEGTIKILDMGLARLSSDGDAATQAELTGTGAVMGTVDYMAPEQALSTKHADARADIYSLGCTLHYLLVGAAVYGGDTLMARLLAHREDPIPSMGANVPDSVQAVFEKMVAKSVDDRFQTMSEVIAALEACDSDRQDSLSLRPSLGTGSSSNVMTFLRNVTLNTTRKPNRQPTKKQARSHRRKSDKLTFATIGLAFLGLAILAGIIYEVRTREAAQPNTDKANPNEDKPAMVDSGRDEKWWDSSAFRKWMADVAAMPAEKQVEAVTKKLMELNPGFDGVVTEKTGTAPPKIENGVVTELRFLSNNVTDISPVRALSGLKSLRCNSEGGKGRLRDLSPLQGMKLTSFYCLKTQVTDLRPLKGMPLKKLEVSGTRVSDLSPIVGMPLTQLHCNDTAVSDLSAIRGMPLEILWCYYTLVSDLTPVEGMNLREIRLSAKNITKGLDLIRVMKSLEVIGIASKETDKYSPEEFWKKFDAGEFGKPIATADNPAFRQWMKDVAAMPAEKQVDAVAKKLMELNPGFDGKVKSGSRNYPPKIVSGVVTEFGFVTNSVTNISPVRALTGLKLLRCDASFDQQHWGTLTDLSPLQGMPLEKLICGTNPISDLSPLVGMPLTMLGCTATNVADLSPLRGMPLTELNCGHMQRLSDLSPLIGMKLTVFYCDHTQVGDISALRGMLLTKFTCGSTRINDLTPLQDMPLVCLHFTPKSITRGIDVIRRMKSLEVIGPYADVKTELHSDEFWKMYDAGEFSK